MDAVFKRAAQELDELRDVVLVTIVDAVGSAPRKTGSLMIVGASGRLAGTIGGGSIEYQSELFAKELLDRKASCLRSFNLNEKDTDGLGMTCGGDVDVWFQYIAHTDAAWCEVAKSASQALEFKQGGWLILSLAEALPSLFSAKKDLVAGTMPADVEALCASACARVGELFSMPLQQKERAIVFGGGHVAQALVPILASIDFATVVFDNRPEYANSELFPCADDIILGDYLTISEYIDLAPDDFVVVMTHGHSFDFEIQAQILRSELAYVGVIGSARKTAVIHERLLGVGIPEEKIATVHMPIGTKIGAETPAEIAVSIAGEMISIRAELRNAAKNA